MPTLMSRTHFVSRITLNYVVPCYVIDERCDRRSVPGMHLHQMVLRTLHSVKCYDELEDVAEFWNGGAVISLN